MVVIPDEYSKFLGAAQRYLAHVVNAIMAEAYALRDGFELAKYIGCNRFIIESNC